MFVLFIYDSLRPGRWNGLEHFAQLKTDAMILIDQVESTPRESLGGIMISEEGSSFI